MKPTSAVIGPGDEIGIANPDNETHHEAELVVVIGKRAQCVDAESSRDYVLGYTCGNDVSDRNLQAQDGQFVRAKGFDTYAPIGPRSKPGSTRPSSRSTATSMVRSGRTPRRAR